MRLGWIVTPSVLAVAAACSKMGEPKLIPPITPTEGQSITSGTVSGRVIGADSARPSCPVTIHYDAVLMVSKLGGKLQYRWERSGGTQGPLQEMDLPASALAGTAEVTLKSDEWMNNAKGEQLTVSDQVHVLSPIDMKSFVTAVETKCY